MVNFADPKNDLAFKKIFGNEQYPEVLISFLNAVLDFQGEREISEVSLTNPYQIPEIRELKQTVLDVRAKTVTGEQFIVEMQNESESHFDKRSLYYSAKAYSSQLKKGELYPKLKPVYFVGILNFRLFEGNPHYLSRHLILDKETHAHYLKDFEFAFIEVKKFRKQEEELVGIIDQWIYFLKEAPQLDEVPASLAAVPAIQQAFELANQYTWELAEAETYEYLQLKQLSHQYTLAEKAEKSFNKGREEGREEGERKRALEIAKKLLSQGMNRETVSQITGLAKDELSTLCVP